MSSNSIPLFVLSAGLLIMAAILIKAGLERFGVPGVVGHILLGFGLRLADMQYGFVNEQAWSMFEFAAGLGLVCLLFRVGLESKVAHLVHQLGRASIIWIGNVGLSGLLGYAVARFILQLDLIPSLAAATALTATSVGVSVIVWRESDALDTPTGQLILDVAELDDLSSVMLMALLLAMAPALCQGTGDSPVMALAGEIGVFTLKVLGFGALCILFSRYLEDRMTSFFGGITPQPDPMLLVASTGFVIAAIAGLLGFSTAIGAFFAGLVFSRDSRAVRMDASFSAIYEALTPFFFIQIGVSIDPRVLPLAAAIGLPLLLAAIIGKVLGAGIPALPLVGTAGAAMIGVSMMPRAEMAMVVIQQGRAQGAWFVPDQLYAGLVMIVLITCIISPILLRILMKKVSQPETRMR